MSVMYAVVLQNVLLTVLLVRDPIVTMGTPACTLAIANRSD